MRRRPALWISAGLVVAAAVVGLVVVTALTDDTDEGTPAASEDDPPAADPEPEPEPEPEPCLWDETLDADDPRCVEPPPPPEPVIGTVDEVTIEDLSSTGTELTRIGSETDAGVPRDDEAIDAGVDEVAGAVDGLLTAVQLDDDLPDVPGVDGDVAPVLGTLTDPDDPITAAVYRVRVGALGEPEWLSVTAELDRDAGPVSAVFTFAPGDEHAELLAVEHLDAEVAR